MPILKLLRFKIYLTSGEIIGFSSDFRWTLKEPFISVERKRGKDDKDVEIWEEEQRFNIRFVKKIERCLYEKLS